MFKRLLPSLALGLCMAGPALAQSCPDERTAKLGFVLEKQGTKTEVRPASDHFVHASNIYRGAGRQDVLYYRGLFAVSRFDERTRSIIIPVSDLRSVFPLHPKARRAVTYAPATPTKVGALVSLELTVSGEEEMSLGPCVYDVLVIRNRFFNGEGQVTSEHTDLYAPELGFVLGRRYDERDGSRTTVQYQTIRPLGQASP